MGFSLTPGIGPDQRTDHDHTGTGCPDPARQQRSHKQQHKVSFGWTCKIAFNIEKVKDNFKIKSLLVTDKEPIYDFEVFDEISKSEFIDVYKLENKDEFLNRFYEDNPFMLKSEMEEGVFFTRFNFNNNHVKEDVYVINNDIKSIYYQLGEELFVGTYSEKDRKYINKFLLTKYKDFLTVSESYFFEENVLYDFVESGSDDFEDFLD